MKIYILADMEGISGIRKYEEVKSEFPTEYLYGREMMIQDINNAVDACFKSGASEVIVCDTHGGGGQVQIGKMDQRALYETPANGCMMPSLDASFDGLILLGHHAKAGTLYGFLDHTMCSMSWFEYKINGNAIGEIGIEAALAGHYDVPVIVVVGDEAATVEAKEYLKNPECATVKWANSRNRAKCLSLPQAHAIISKAISKALKNIKTYKPYKPSLPAHLELTFYRSDMAEIFSGRPDIERIGARTISKTVNSLLDIRIC
jgi:D-amino peptidase